MIRCNSCELVQINGVTAHELGCRDRHVDLLTGMFRHTCRECGCEVQSEYRDRWECNCNQLEEVSEYE
jgi:hypothetical protein